MSSSISWYFFVICLPASLLLPDGLHRTPPMGWTSWNTFFEQNSEEKMISQVDALLELGLDQFGYTFLTIDDFWQLPDRDPDTGMMIADPDRFPDGISHLSDYMHTRGLKIGIYSSAGRYTCSGDTIHLTLTHDEYWCQDSCQDHSATRRLMCRCCLTGRLTTSNMTTAIPGDDLKKMNTMMMMMMSGWMVRLISVELEPTLTWRCQLNTILVSGSLHQRLTGH